MGGREKDAPVFVYEGGLDCEKVLLSITMLLRVNCVCIRWVNKVSHRKDLPFDKYIHFHSIAGPQRTALDFSNLWGQKV